LTVPSVRDATDFRIEVCVGVHVLNLCGVFRGDAVAKAARLQDAFFSWLLLVRSRQRFTRLARDGGASLGGGAVARDRSQLWNGGS
jgi:hypothetical protein